MSWSKATVVPFARRFVAGAAITGIVLSYAYDKSIYPFGPCYRSVQAHRDGQGYIARSYNPWVDHYKGKERERAKMYMTSFKRFVRQTGDDLERKQKPFDGVVLWSDSDVCTFRAWATSLHYVVEECTGRDLADIKMTGRWEPTEQKCLVSVDRDIHGVMATVPKYSDPTDE